MEVVVDLRTGAVTLEGWELFGSLGVRAVPDPERGDPGSGAALTVLSAALSRHRTGRLDPTGDVLLPPGTLRRLASEAAAGDGRSTDSGWESGFTAMLEHADRNGWIAADGAVRAHLEWGEP